MTTDVHNPSKGIALLLSFIFGPLGIDKFYLGLTTLGIIQLVLTLSYYGFALSLPWALLCSLSLLIAIAIGGNAFMYPGIKWGPDKKLDKIIMGVILLFILLSPLFILKTKKEEDKKENYGCSSCSRGMLGPYQNEMNKKYRN